MTKNVLYVGNYLKGPKNPSYMFTLGPLLEALGYRIIYTSSANNKLVRLLDMIWSVVRHRRYVDVVLIDTYSTQNFYYAVVIAWLCRRFKLIYIPILHGGNLPNRLKESPSQCQLLFGNATANVAPSRYLEQSFRDFGFKNIYHIPNAVALENLPYLRREKAELKLLWVRRLQDIYNPMMALQVFLGLKAKGLKAELCMVGADHDGSLDTLKSFAQKYALNVDFSGYQSKEEWVALSKNYDIFLNTSTIDNTPLSVIEVMALGLGVVSTNVGGMPYLIDHGIEGILVDSKNVEAMTSAVLNLVEDPELFQELTAKARQKVETFDTIKVKQQWKELFRSLGTK
ncbi:glycosyltransferase family 4 protein [Winogradskyella aurantiaca]|uniref:glycosyltransferase family 4 protein n=1 Tax=Winogradskyella aurantiaca TaxID=2219558 RepID=UPI000E1D208F|nr:glycosyltransferase family 4 protein [Winogradskyella aurantiaca]